MDYGEKQKGDDGQTSFPSLNFPQCCSGKWEIDDVRTDYCIDAPELAASLAKYQDPAEADKVLKIQKVCCCLDSSVQ